MKGLITIFVFFSLSAVANIAQPGIWNAGGSGNYSLMYPDESRALGKIQMVDERITVLVYPGFAVVKGCYHMYNPDTSDVTIHSGYPVSSVYDISVNVVKKEIAFSNLHELMVLQDGDTIEIDKRPNTGRTYFANNNWYIWENTFPAKDTTHVQVFFIVNTNNAKLIDSRSKREINAFIYLLESGASWKQPIEKGEIRIVFRGGLTTKDVMGLEPQDRFLRNEQNLIWEFEHLSPTLNDNLILTYNKKTSDFRFEDVLPRRDELYAELQKCSGGEINTDEYLPATYDIPISQLDFDDEHSKWWLYGGGLAGLLLVGFLFKRSILK